MNIDHPPSPLDYAPELFIPGATYEHYKGGLYELVGVASDSTNEPKYKYLVVYRSLRYGELRVREIQEFLEYVKWPDDTWQPRFRRLSEKDNDRG